AYVKNKYHLPESFIFYPANTWPHKNHVTLIKALESYYSCYGAPPDLVLTGYESDAHGDVSAAIRNSVIKDKIHFLGYIDKDHMPAIYKNASCLVFPSMYEGFGIPLVEAMRTDCPIIAANNTAIPEIAGDAAIYFDTMDEVELSVCIKYIMSDDRLRAALIANGRKQARLFSFEKSVRKTLEVLEMIHEQHQKKKD
ncbi:MAG: glycosyltransferase family 4 protein, partial [bacterium]|nr:glycosyltransferase family 4 protein [bacterium]